MIKKYRTLIRVCEIEENYFYIIIPGWNVHTKIRLSFEEVPREIKKLVEPGKRFHAYVNIGVESVNDLCFTGWETE